MSHSGRVHAVVVTYEPDADQLARLLDAIRPQVDAVTIVDNASTAVRPWLRAAAERAACELVQLEQNLGIAAAHNVGIARARAASARAVLLLDQDSTPDAGMVRHLTDAAVRLEHGGERVAAVGPSQIDRRTLEHAPFVRFGFVRNAHLRCEAAAGEAIRCDHLISSGMLIPLAALDAIGGMDESLFIDLVDTEWSFRALSRGFALFGVCGASMYHTVGSRIARVGFPRSRAVIVHPPARLYYIFRNHLLLYRRSYVPLRWKAQDALRLAYKCGVFATCIPPRLTHSSIIVHALLDGIRGRTGPQRGRTPGAEVARGL